MQQQPHGSAVDLHTNRFPVIAPSQLSATLQGSGGPHHPAAIACVVQNEPQLVASCSPINYICRGAGWPHHPPCPSCLCTLSGPVNAAVCCDCFLCAGERKGPTHPAPLACVHRLEPQTLPFAVIVSCVQGAGWPYHPPCPSCLRTPYGPLNAAIGCYCFLCAGEREGPITRHIKHTLNKFLNVRRNRCAFAIDIGSAPLFSSAVHDLYGCRHVWGCCPNQMRGATGMHQWGASDSRYLGPNHQVLLYSTAASRLGVAADVQNTKRTLAALALR